MENKKILVADDEQTIRELMDLILKTKFNGYPRKIYSDGHSLKEELDKGLERIALVILDNDVPDESLGLKIIKEYSGRGVPFIMMSGYDICKEAKKNGAYDFSEKPFQLDSLIKSIENALEYKK